ncbi:MAG: antitoxin [Deltaproteobacteria bacterium]|nr:antitoxin [Deltaproteobacteria bacterium]MBL7176003.1 antitoxin [Desulfobacteraceae bacterium]
MNEEVFREIERIRDELIQIVITASHAQHDWNEFINKGDEAYLKAVAYDLHGFYTGLERIFKSVANTIDDKIPEGENWHKDLLEQMALDIAGLRPAVLSQDTVDLLDEFMRFRHRIRNIYSFNLIPDRVKDLVEKLPTVLEKAKGDLSAFVQFLEEISS